MYLNTKQFLSGALRITDMELSETYQQNVYYLHFELHQQTAKQFKGHKKQHCI